MIIIPSLVVQFRDQSIGQPVNWSWDFGDGNSSTARNPQHTYVGLESPGEYTVTLTSTDAFGVKSTSSKVIQVPAQSGPGPGTLEVRFAHVPDGEPIVVAYDATIDLGVYSLGYNLFPALFVNTGDMDITFAAPEYVFITDAGVVFELDSLPAGYTLAGGASGAWAIGADPSSTGIYTSTVSIDHDGSNQKPFIFHIQIEFT